MTTLCDGADDRSDAGGCRGTITEGPHRLLAEEEILPRRKTVERPVEGLAREPRKGPDRESTAQGITRPEDRPEAGRARRSR